MTRHHPIFGMLRRHFGGRRILEIDLCALAAFRVSIGVLLLSNLLVRAGSLVAHYTDAGVLPRSRVLASGDLVLSLHMLGGTAAFQGALLLIAGLAALALLAGFHTRLATVASWVLLISLHARNPYVINSGDVILGLLLFWAMFLPLGARWSVDSLRHGGDAPRRVVSIATAGILLQIGMIYFFSVFHKTDPVWTVEHTAIYYALSIDAFATGAGAAVVALPAGLLALVTRATLWLELWGPLLAFSPLFNAPIRTAVAFSFIGFHVGLAATMTLGLFPFVCMAAWLLFLPASFWDRVGAGLPSISAVDRARRRMSRRHRSSGRRPWDGMLSGPAQVALALVLVYTVQANLYSVTHAMVGGPAERAWDASQRVALAVGFQQNWRMFAPRPAIYDGWYVMQGSLADGTTVNLFDPSEVVPWEKPRLVSATYRNQRWRKYLLDHFQKDSFEPRRQYLADYLADRWHHLHPDRPLDRVEVHIVESPPPPPGQGRTEAPRLLLEREVGRIVQR